MKAIITAAQVADLSFGADKGVIPFLSDETIIAAQVKFIVPVLGKLFDALEEGRYPDLMEKYVRPALAACVKYLALPSLAAQASPSGIIRYMGNGFEEADGDSVKRLLSRSRANADALVKSLSDHLETTSSMYPEYDSEENIRNRVSLTGGVVLSR